jgi:hypothetical protein
VVGKQGRDGGSKDGTASGNKYRGDFILVLAAASSIRPTAQRGSVLGGINHSLFSYATHLTSTTLYITQKSKLVFRLKQFSSTYYLLCKVFTCPYLYLNIPRCNRVHDPLYFDSQRSFLVQDLLGFLVVGSISCRRFALSCFPPPPCFSPQLQRRRAGGVMFASASSDSQSSGRILLMRRCHVCSIRKKKGVMFAQVLVPILSG